MTNRRWRSRSANGRRSRKRRAVGWGPSSPATRQSPPSAAWESAPPAARRSASTASRGSVRNGRPCTITRTVPGRRGSGTTAPTTRPAAFSLAVAVIGRHGALRPHAEEFLHPVLDLGHQRGIVLEEELGVLPSLPDALIAVGVPGTGLLDDVRLGGEVHHQPGVAD